MSVPTWGEQWTRWFNRYREARPGDQPVGWYTIADLREAFDAGARALDQQGLETILDRTTTLYRELRKADGTPEG